MTRICLAALAAAAVFTAGSALAQSTVAAMSASLSASPAAYSGHCPGVITFTGTIVVRGHIDPAHPVQIGYQFLRSDNATGPISYYMVTQPGAKQVSTTWTLGGPALPHYAGWEQLKAWPTGHEGGFGYAFSPKATFTLRCAPAARP
ncbi:MAG TPA: hypothetical protein VG939_18785 [Caulobacteraceae bacterium]|nr:hypothetical protein [Caulobacteraceae bacterium]